MLKSEECLDREMKGSWSGETVTVGQKTRQTKVEKKRVIWSPVPIQAQSQKDRG
jgi:hypothetical protein